MCTATYLPLNKKEFILTHNRDEHSGRKSALHPEFYKLGDAEVVYPKDAQANGTWILSSDNSYTLCLLNGGRIKHKPSGPYRHSRGLVLLDFFKYQDTQDFVTNYNFNELEPFTLIVINNTNDIIIDEIIWDAKLLTCNTQDSSIPKIWSSATLYNDHEITQRQAWFAHWINENDFNTNNILKFHNFSPSDNEGFIINRSDNKLTVSITSVLSTDASTEFYYKDLVTEKDNLVQLFPQDA